MGPVSGIVLYLVVWFMTFFVALPLRLKTQGENGKVEPGTHASAPQVHNLKKKALITTGVAAVIWAILAWIILTDVITVRDLNMFTRDYWVK
jgi:predicted secreted protein